MHFKCTDGPETGDVHLTIANRGRVEVFLSGHWEPVINTSLS